MYLRYLEYLLSLYLFTFHLYNFLYVMELNTWISYCKKKKHKIQAREINKPGLCLKDPPKAPEPDQRIQNTPADQESDKFE
jgi:DNA-directed RNA polymerase specialized sigma24 family protein